MTPETHRKLLDILMLDINESDYQELVEVSIVDVDRMEPVINDLVEQAYLRGQLQVYLKIASEITKFRDEVARAVKSRLTRKL